MVHFKCAVRASSIKSLNGHHSLSAAQDHAQRLDVTSQKRSIHPDQKPIAWSKAGIGKELDYVEAFKIHKTELSAGERKNSSLAEHLLLVISPEWLEETGDPHDPDNPRVKALFENAREWVESWAGQGSVWGLRYDRDEAGSGIIDVFVSPVHEQKQRKSDKTKKVISVNKSIQALFEMERVLDPMVKRPRGALQSSWARWCQDYLDPRIERGDYKEKTKRDHIHADILAPVLQQKTKLLKEVKQIQEEKQAMSVEITNLKKQIEQQRVKVREEISKAQQQQKRRVRNLAEVILLDKDRQDRLKLLAETSHIVRRYVFEELPKVNTANFNEELLLKPLYDFLENMNEQSIAQLFQEYKQAVNAFLDNISWVIEPKGTMFEGQLVEFAALFKAILEKIKPALDKIFDQLSSIFTMEPKQIEIAQAIKQDHDEEEYDDYWNNSASM